MSPLNIQNFGFGHSKIFFKAFGSHKKNYITINILRILSRCCLAGNVFGTSHAALPHQHCR